MMRTETILRETAEYDYDEIFDVDDPDFESVKRKSNRDVPLVNSNNSRITVQQQDNSPSCLTCGVNWAADHVSLDCDECGGFALRRPCPLCAGRCRQLWRRDVILSHSVRKAQWLGQCGFRSNS